MPQPQENKLLSNRELLHEVSVLLDKYLRIATNNSGDACTQEERLSEAKKFFVDFIQSQKLAWADVVIGEYSQYPSHFSISDVLHTQRERNKL